MLFAATTLLAMAASATAAVLPRSSMGQWTVSMEVRPSGYQYAHFEFTSDAYPEKQRSTCIMDPTEDPVYYRCDHTYIDYTFQDGLLKVQQSVQLPNPMTVFGEQEIELTETPENGWMVGAATVPVTKAIA